MAVDVTRQRVPPARHARRLFAPPLDLYEPGEDDRFLFVADPANASGGAPLFTMVQNWLVTLER